MADISVLKPEEYGELVVFSERKSLEDGFGPMLHPDHSTIAVAKDGDEIVGKLYLVNPYHVEGLWVKKEHRGGTIFKRLFDRIEEEARKRGVGHVLAYTASLDMENYLQRIGYKAFGVKVWDKEI